MMKKIADAIGRELKWVQPSAFKRAYELRDGDEVFATLRFRSLLGSFATFESADGTWTFKRVGFFATRITVQDAGEKEMAAFRPRTWTGGGTLELPERAPIKASTNFWSTRLEFTNEKEEPLLRYRKFGGPIHLSSLVEVLPALAALDLPWLPGLGWYLIIKMQDDAMSGAAGAAAAASG